MAPVSRAVTPSWRSCADVRLSGEGAVVEVVLDVVLVVEVEVELLVDELLVEEVLLVEDVLLEKVVRTALA